jgi:hypothetical protein
MRAPRCLPRTLPASGIALARALSVDDVNQPGRQTGQRERLRKITPHRLFLSTMAALAARKVESLADLLRELSHQNDVTVAYEAFYNRLARSGFAELMRQMPSLMNSDLPQFANESTGVIGQPATGIGRPGTKIEGSNLGRIVRAIGERPLNTVDSCVTSPKLIEPLSTRILALRATRRSLGSTIS